MPAVGSPIGPFIGVDRSSKALERIRLLLDHRQIQIRHHPPMGIEDERIWSPKAERGFGRLSHGFIFAADWLGHFETLGTAERRMLGKRAGEILNAWQNTQKPQDSMAYHDETTAQRTINLTAFLNDAAGTLPKETNASLRSVIEHDIHLLMDGAFYAGVNNHGMFQDIALLVTASIYPDPPFPPDALENKAFSRLHEYFSSCFTPDGIHIENTPTYHLLVSQYLKDVVEYATQRGRNSDFVDLAAVLRGADKYAAHAVTPTNRFPPVSDTNPMEIAPARALRVFGSGWLSGVLTDGKDGQFPSERVFVPTTSGYGIYRSSWSRSARYLFFSAAYNADYHKHSDELSVYYAEGDLEILREAGPFGYDRKNPFTNYGFSSDAHNTLLVDGRGLPRVDGRRGDTYLIDEGSTAGHLRVRGGTHRYPETSWERSVQIGDSSPLLILDRVRGKKVRQYTLLWHFGSSIDVTIRENQAILASDRGEVGTFTWTSSHAPSVQLARGKPAPRPQGWAFPRMGEAVPATTLIATFTAQNLDVEWTLQTAP